MIGIYLSGTGNTKHCVEKLVKRLNESAQSIPLEHTEIIQMLEKHDTIILGYPTQFSNAPFMVRDFIESNASLWNRKKVFCVSTMGLFSGDGTGCTARILKKYGATILGGLQLKMPDSVCDSKLLKKSIEENKQIVKAADERIEQIAKQIMSGNYPQEGLSFIAHIKGLLGQRLWFYRKTINYTMM
jgi:flavodoxin